MKKGATPSTSPPPPHAAAALYAKHAEIKHVAQATPTDRATTSLPSGTVFVPFLPRNSPRRNNFSVPPSSDHPPPPPSASFASALGSLCAEIYRFLAEPLSPPRAANAINTPANRWRHARRPTCVIRVVTTSVDARVGVVVRTAVVIHVSLKHLTPAKLHAVGNKQHSAAIATAIYSVNIGCSISYTPWAIKRLLTGLWPQ